ncbi:hypothetical protein ACFRCG_17715 [Embleya sp. NPDC056575]|uniref:hypothetical protein n=1 Tax=unclassified Embleya TaxID=2699296 RepID=UPI0036AD6692
MGVDLFWRRLSGETVATRSPQELGAMVPYWFDPEFGPLGCAGMVMGVERLGDLMHAVLTFGGRAEGACQLPVYGGDVRTEGEVHPEFGFLGTEVWVLEPSDVREAARFLRDVDVAERVRVVEPVLAEDVDSPSDLLVPWDDALKESLCERLVRLGTFFTAAANAGDAVVKYQVA